MNRLGSVFKQNPMSLKEGQQITVTVNWSFIHGAEVHQSASCEVLHQEAAGRGGDAPIMSINL